MAFEPRNITKEHVLKGLEKIEKNQIVLEPSTRWLVEINNKTYPPKEIMRYAHEQMNGEKLWNYSGGDGTNNFLAKMGFKIIDKSISNESLFFNDIIEEVKQLLLSDNKTKDLFTFQKPNKNYVWIGDNQDIIGYEMAHYEISLDKVQGNFTVDVHFEGTQNNKDQFKNISQNVSLPLKAFAWQKGKSIRYENGIDKNSPDLIDEIKNQLIYIENTIGDEIRKIIKRIKTTVTEPSLNINMHYPLNQILYGPPGTGKTYNTINKALQIIGENIEGKSRAEIKDLFDQRMEEVQIVFSTFHQSMCYEDFIEGIKPDTNKAQNIIYEVKPGIFKKLASTAENNWLDATKGIINQASFEKAFEKLKEDWEEDPEMKFSLKKMGSEYTILGFTASSIQFKKASGGTGHTMSISTLRDYFYNIREIVPTGIGIYYPSILEKLRSYQPSSVVKKELKKYVLIIDEINRGNVSQIFGELITLIEDDKRLGKKEALEVTLPYSKERFGVPPNLHIIGTMNTADRSVEALDAALRRRFSFEEMPPKPELLSPQRKIWELWWEHKTLGWDEEPYKSQEIELYDLLGITEDFDPKEQIWEKMKKEGKMESQISYFYNIHFTGINLETLLRTINKRIELLLDKDHQIGHSYFMSVSSLADLKIVFQNKIIPLLQEYFFGDYGKIGLVLGEGFFETEEKNKQNIFAEFHEYDSSDYSERPIFKLKNLQELSPDEFKIAIDLLLK